jgi:hypothetical protein
MDIAVTLIGLVFGAVLVSKSKASPQELGYNFSAFIKNLFNQDWRSRGNDDDDRRNYDDRDDRNRPPTSYSKRGGMNSPTTDRMYSLQASIDPSGRERSDRARRERFRSPSGAPHWGRPLESSAERGRGRGSDLRSGREVDVEELQSDVVSLSIFQHVLAK